VMAVWRQASTRALRAEVLRRWTNVAQICVLGLLASGLFAAWRQVGSLAALRTTDYGQLFLAKLSLVAIMLVLGARHRSQQAEQVTARSVFAQHAVGIVVIVISTVLSSVIPARAAVDRPITIRAQTASTRTDLTLSPARTGLNTIHLYTYDRNNRQLDFEDAELILTHEATGTVLNVTPYRSGVGHVQARGIDLKFAGTWRVAAKLFLTDFDVEVASGNAVVR
jgi:copper transport protein